MEQRSDGRLEGALARIAEQLERLNRNVEALGAVLEKSAARPGPRKGRPPWQRGGRPPWGAEPRWQKERGEPRWQRDRGEPRWKGERGDEAAEGARRGREPFRPRPKRPREFK